MITLEKTSEGVKTFFFGLHPMFGGELDVGAPEDDFGGLHCLVSVLPPATSIYSFFEHRNGQ